MSLLYYGFFAFLLGFLALVAARKTEAPLRTELVHAFFIASMVFLHLSAFRNMLAVMDIVLFAEITERSQELHLTASPLPLHATGWAWLLVSVGRFSFWAPVTLGLVGVSRRARWAVTKLLPLVYFVDGMQMYFSTLQHISRPIETDLSHRLFAFGVFQAIYFVFLGWLYAWMFFFYRSRTADSLFEPTAELSLRATGAEMASPEQNRFLAQYRFEGPGKREE